MDLLLQILISSFVIGAIYALSAAGMTIIFGVSGILNLAHGAIMVAAALIAWYAALHMGLGPYLGALIGIGASIVITYLLYILVIIPLQRSRHIADEEMQVFRLVATLLFALVLEGILGWAFGSSPVSTPPLVQGAIELGGNTIPHNSLLIGAVAWIVLIGLWLFVSYTRLGKAMLAASMSAKGLAIVGYNIKRIHLMVWGLYGLLAGVAGVLLASFIGASSSVAINLTAISFTIVILGGLGSVLGSLVGAYILGLLSMITAYLVSSSIVGLPGLILLIVILFVRPQGLFGRG